MIAVPAVGWLGALILALGIFLAQQTIVLHIVHRLQQAGTVGCLCRQERNGAGSAHQSGGAKEPGAHRPALQQLIVQAPEALALACQTRLLDLHRRLDTAHHRPRQELPEALAHATAGRVFGCGHTLVVAKVVFHHKVGVTGRREGGHRHQLVQLVGLVPEFVSCVDAHPVNGANRQSETNSVGHWRLLTACQPGAHESHGVLGWNKRLHDSVVIFVLLKRLYRRFRRVALVFADGPVQPWNDAMNQCWSRPGKGPELFRGDGIPGHGGKAYAGQGGTHQPKIAFGVFPVLANFGRGRTLSGADAIVGINRLYIQLVAGFCAHCGAPVIRM